MALGIAIRGVLYLVLDEENVERIQANDPFDFDVFNAGSGLTLRLPPKIVIAYARKDEQAKIVALAETPDELLKYLRRGYTETASDFTRAIPYETLKGDPDGK